MGRGWKIRKRRGEVISSPHPSPITVILLPPPFCPAFFPSLTLLEGGVTLELGGDLQQAGLVLDLEKDSHGLVSWSIKDGIRAVGQGDPRV